MRFVKFAVVIICATGAAHSADTAITQNDTVWTIENDALCVTVAAAEGRIRVLDKRAQYTWRQPGEVAGDSANSAKFDAVRRVEQGLAFETSLNPQDSEPIPALVTLTVPKDRADLVVEVDVPDRACNTGALLTVDPFALDTPKAALAVADYSDGHLYPLDTQPFPKTFFAADRLDMPWLGLCDLEKGFGCALIIDTSDDAGVHVEPCAAGGRTFAALHIRWWTSKSAFAYPRRLIYRFVSEGGYVALAKAYRAQAQQQGLLVTLDEKRKKNPNLDKLFGAPDVWGKTGLAFAKEARALGVQKMLIQGRCAAEEMRAINEMGFLTSEYDNYTDVMPLEAGKEPDAQHDVLPDAAVLQSNQERMKAWLTWDKKTQYMKRSPALWLRTAQLVIPKALGECPFTGRFIDVTTAEGLYEDFDPAHPLTRGGKRHCGEELLGYVRSLGLVTGGEHGIWWAVPHLDYIEGMMSGTYFSWPAGHLLRPESKDQKFPDCGSWEGYAKWGIGHEWRVPLWELVFHDCVVSTWYWGDSNDYLMKAAPEISAKKDAYNVLYGTMPMLWADEQGAWSVNRELFLRTYRNVCPIFEAVAGTEMLSHEFVTPDHHVQRTRFSDGTEVVVNFGETAYTATVGGREYTLPQNGYATGGPHVKQPSETAPREPAASH